MCKKDRVAGWLGGGDAGGWHAEGQPWRTSARVIPEWEMTVRFPVGRHWAGAGGMLLRGGTQGAGGVARSLGWGAGRLGAVGTLPGEPGAMGTTGV